MWRMDRQVFLVDCVYLLKNSITFRVERNAIETFYLKFTGNKVNGSDHCLQLTAMNNLFFSIIGFGGWKINQCVCRLNSEGLANKVDPLFILCYTGCLHPLLRLPKTSHHCKILRNKDEKAVM